MLYQLKIKIRTQETEVKLMGSPLLLHLSYTVPESLQGDTMVLIFAN